MRIGLILLACGLVWGQVDTGELRLSVSDSTGLALPSSGTLVSAASQTRREFRTDDAGRFTFQHLPLGMYRLTMEHAGFARSSSLIEIRSAVPREVRLELKVEAAATEVLVTDAATLIDPHSTGMAYAVGAQQIQEQQSAIPGRGLMDLVNRQSTRLNSSHLVIS